MIHSSALARKPGVASAIRLLEAWVESQMEYRGLPGVSIGVVHDQNLIWARGFGQADLLHATPAGAGTLYRIASITKVFTATALLQLRDAGRLRLDDPVEEHLAWFQIGRKQGHEDPITIRQLLTHTAGLPREAPFPYWTDNRFPTRDEVRNSIETQQTIHQPNSRWKYSNLAFTIAGELVSTISGESYADYMRRHILRPLGMRSTDVGVPERLRERLAVGYGRRMPDGTRAVRPFSDIQAIDPAGGIASSVEDLARFAALQFRDGPAGGKQILKGSTLREMHRVHWLKPDWTGGWGLGFSVTHTPERDLVGHGGWLAGYQSQLAFSPREKVAVIVMTNADDGLPYLGAPGSITDRVFKWLAPEIVRAAAAKPKAAAADPGLERYVGKYRSPWGDTQVLVMDGKLVAVPPTTMDPLGLRVTLNPEGEHTFRTESEGPFVEDGDPIVFELGTDGKAARLRWGENTRERVS